MFFVNFPSKYMRGAILFCLPNIEFLKTKLFPNLIENQIDCTSALRDRVQTVEPNQFPESFLFLNFKFLSSFSQTSKTLIALPLKNREVYTILVKHSHTKIGIASSTQSLDNVENPEQYIEVLKPSNTQISQEYDTSYQI